jgi:hypothetical protein
VIDALGGEEAIHRRRIAQVQLGVCTQQQVVEARVFQSANQGGAHEAAVPRDEEARLAGTWNKQNAATGTLPEFEAATAFFGVVWRR